MRIEWIDNLKFLGIFAIYLGHLASGAGKFYPFVFIYHVPLFFFISGFFANGHLKYTAFEFIKSKFLRLLIPYFVFTLLTLAFRALSEGFEVWQLTDAIYGILNGLRNDPFVGSLWFFNCMFIMVVIDYFAMWLIRNNYISLAASLCVYFYTQIYMGHNPIDNPQWFMNVDSALSYWWLLCLGRVSFPLIKNQFITDNRKLSLLFGGVFIAIAAYTLMDMKSLFLLIAQKATSIPGGDTFNSVDRLLVITSLIMANVFIAKTMPTFNFVQSVGINTLNICGIELIVKTTIAAIVSIIGLKLLIDNVVAAFAYTFICLYVANLVTRRMAIKLPSLFHIQ